jgi:hypothetical protein
MGLLGGEMVRKATAFLITVCLLYAARAMAITGNEWKRLPEIAQQVYVIGVVDTWNNLAQIIEATYMERS